MKGKTRRHLWIYGLAMLVGGTIFSQGNLPCFTIWQGFSQQWGYPHAIGRLGDWVENQSDGPICSLQCVHGAAGGSEADRADFTQYYARIQSNLVQQQAGVATFELVGKEGEYITEVQTEDVEFLEATDPKTQYAVLLNGFDLSTSDGTKPDDLQEIDLGIDSVWRDLPSGKISFRLRAALRFSCRSGECEPLNQVVDYDLKLFWLVIGGHGFNAKPAAFGSGRNWEKQDTALMPPMPRVALLGEAYFPKATVAITGFHLLLDREHRMLGWESSVQAGKYENGMLMAQIGMAFVQNNGFMQAAYRQRQKGMHLNAPKAHAGSLAWEMNVALLQFEEATIEPLSRVGHVPLDGKNASEILLISK